MMTAKKEKTQEEKQDELDIAPELQRIPPPQGEAGFSVTFRGLIDPRGIDHQFTFRAESVSDWLQTMVEVTNFKNTIGLAELPDAEVGSPALDEVTETKRWAVNNPVTPAQIVSVPASGGSFVGTPPGQLQPINVPVQSGLGDSADPGRSDKDGNYPGKTGVFPLAQIKIVPKSTDNIEVQFIPMISNAPGKWPEVRGWNTPQEWEKVFKAVGVTQLDGKFGFAGEFSFNGALILDYVFGDKMSANQKFYKNFVGLRPAQ